MKHDKEQKAYMRGYWKAMQRKEKKPKGVVEVLKQTNLALGREWIKHTSLLRDIEQRQKVIRKALKVLDKMEAKE